MHTFTPFYSPFFAHGFMSMFIPFLLVAAVWTIILKGFSLWYAARGSQKWWFFFLLIVNTLGILEIIYLIWFRRDKLNTHHSHTPANDSSSQA
jgi:methionyl-tRNA synthetase